MVLRAGRSTPADRAEAIPLIAEGFPPFRGIAARATPPDYSRRCEAPLSPSRWRSATVRAMASASSRGLSGTESSGASAQARLVASTARSTASGERVRLAGLDTVEHDLMTLDDVIEHEMPDVRVPGELCGQPRAQIARPAATRSHLTTECADAPRRCPTGSGSPLAGPTMVCSSAMIPIPDVNGDSGPTRRGPSATTRRLESRRRVSAQPLPEWR